MDILTIISGITGLAGAAAGLYAFFFVRQEREKKELENDSQAILHYKSLIEDYKSEIVRLREKNELKNKRIDELTEKWISERCVIKSCKYRLPPSEMKAPSSIEDTL